ncbi:MAG: ferritin-like domain-containing protein [Chthoniobacteraceae bacterium]
MKLDHPALVTLLQKAYSGEKAAAFAYIGHARSLRDPAAKAAVRQIEQDEWQHRENVLGLMRRYDVPVSRWLEVKLHIIGRVISASCHVIGRFMPFFFAGKLESGNVCEYFVMMRHFHSLGIHDHDAMLYEMGMKEKEHEVYFLEQIRKSRLLPLFERLFSWGAGSSANDVDLEKKFPVRESDQYCKTYKAHEP